MGWGDVLDGGPHALRVGAVSAFAQALVCMGRMTYCSPKNVFDSCERLTIFPYGQDIVGNVVLLAF